MIGFANAKINIGLQIIGRRSDGYHLINTVMYPVREFNDVVEIVPSKSFGLVTTGLPLDVVTEKNLVYKAYQLLKDHYNLPPVNIFLHKIIPYGAGLGGGSSDAAQVILLVNKLFNLGLSTEQMKDFASRLGADCAFFIENTPALATGTGTELTALDLNLDSYNIVILKPDFGISTKEAYSMVKPSEPGFDLAQIAKLPVEKWKDYIVNDFERFLFPKYPVLADIKSRLYDSGALYASLSGSGSALYGIFPDKTDLTLFGDIFAWQSYDFK